MKKELSPQVILGAIVGIVVVVGLAIFMVVRGDPAMQGPNPPPRFDPAAKEAESHSGPSGTRPERGPGDAPPGKAPGSP